MLGNMKPLAKSVFPRIYKNLALLAPKRSKQLSTRSHLCLKGIRMETGTITGSIIDTVNQYMYHCSLITKSSGNKILESAVNTKGLTSTIAEQEFHCALALLALRFLSLFLDSEAAVDFLFFLFPSSFVRDKGKVTCRYLRWKQTTNTFFELN